MRARNLNIQVRELLDSTPAVVLIGSRQVGKTTLARKIGDERNAVYLDLESPSDRAKLADPESYLNEHMGRLVILDEVHRVPDLFPVLRGRIDEGRRRGIRSEMYLLLGSASIDLLDRSAESLAGRVSYVELHPLSLSEVQGITADPLQTLWVRGGYPDSTLASSESHSYTWRSNFIRTYLEREVPQFSPRKSTEQMRQLWTMLAHLQGQVLNASMLARSIGIDHKTVQAYVHLLEQLLLVRTLLPWHTNTGKRLTKRPKIYVRDSGILHTILGIRTYDDLLGNPIIGQSWEGFVLQQICAIDSNKLQVWFYRTSGGAEVDLLLQFDNDEQWAIEVKRSSAPSPQRGFYEAIADLKPHRALIVYNGTEKYPLNATIEAIPLATLLEEIEARLNSHEFIHGKNEVS